MKLLLLRKLKLATCTIGELYVDGVFECFTLEDVIRPTGQKIEGQTAIPEGLYYVVIDLSKRFGRLMPHILDVPGFEGVRFHGGDTAADTEGCPLLAAGSLASPPRSEADFTALSSKPAVAAFMTKLQAAGKAELEIRS